MTKVHAAVIVAIVATALGLIFLFLKSDDAGAVDKAALRSSERKEAPQHPEEPALGPIEFDEGPPAEGELHQIAPLRNETAEPVSNASFTDSIARTGAMIADVDMAEFMQRVKSAGAEERVAELVRSYRSDLGRQWQKEFMLYAQNSEYLKKEGLTRQVSHREFLLAKAAYDEILIKNTGGDYYEITRFSEARVPGTRKLLEEKDFIKSEAKKRLLALLY